MRNTSIFKTIKTYFLHPNSIFKTIKTYFFDYQNVLFDYQNVLFTTYQKMLETLIFTGFFDNFFFFIFPLII